MGNNELQNLGEEVKRQGEGNSMKDLVFDPATGEFKQKAKWEPSAPGEDTVTGMTEDGFAMHFHL